MTAASAQTVLVTGGAGYIGTHTLVELLAAGYQAVCLDNFSNSDPEALRRVERIAGRPVQQVQGDVRDEAARSVLGGRATPRRRGAVLGRSRTGEACSGLEGDANPARHVRGWMALAAG